MGDNEEREPILTSVVEDLPYVYKPSFGYGSDTSVWRSCSVTYKNDMFVIGGAGKFKKEHCSFWSSLTVEQYENKLFLLIH